MIRLRTVATRRLAAGLVSGLVLASALSGCSSDSPDSSAVESTGAGATDGSTDTGVPRPEGPAADLSDELTGGNGAFSADVASGIKMPESWTEQEFLASGTAHAYTADGDLATDGKDKLTEDADTEADYRTRVLVRRPPVEDFNGTMVVEWLNVSAGLDADPEYLLAHEELFRRGYAWVGVSTQQIGVEGGDVAVAVEGAGDLGGKGLKNIDPARYGSLEHPGDAFSYDMFTQIGRALRGSGADGTVGGLEPERLLAIGESQSAFALTTYANGVQPLTQAYDGFLVHSRGGSGLGLGEAGGASDIAGAIGGEATTIRTDLAVPVLILQTETDLFSVIGYYPARQPDADRIRLWEVAGTAHADARLLGSVASSIDCGAPINHGPQHFVAKAAIRALDTWVRTGEAPPEAPRLDVGDGPDAEEAIERDADGIALGGIRTPQVDVPVDRLSGEPGPSTEIICLLLGSAEPLSDARLAERYPSRQDYVTAYAQATDEAIATGYVLEDDRQAMVDDAQPDRIGA